MVMNELLGRRITAFKFEGAPGMNQNMKLKVGEVGIITHAGRGYCNVIFTDGRKWSYPYPEILQHILPEEEVDLDKLFKDLIKIIKIVK
jgi:hypothetical protein